MAYLTNILSKTHFIFDLGMWEVIKWCKRLQCKIGLIPTVEILKMASKMAASKVLLSLDTGLIYVDHYDLFDKQTR